MCQKQVSKAWTSNYIPQYLWDVIICPCPRCLPQDLQDVGWLYQQTNSCAVVFVIDCVCEEVSMPTQGAPAECCNKNHGIKRTVTFSCTTSFCNEFQVSSFWHISHNLWLYWRLSISNLIISQEHFVPIIMILKLGCLHNIRAGVYILGLHHLLILPIHHCNALPQSIRAATRPMCYNWTL